MYHATVSVRRFFMALALSNVATSLYGFGSLAQLFQTEVAPASSIQTYHNFLRNHRKAVVGTAVGVGVLAAAWGVKRVMKKPAQVAALPAGEAKTHQVIGNEIQREISAIMDAHTICDAQKATFAKYILPDSQGAQPLYVGLNRYSQGGASPILLEFRDVVVSQEQKQSGVMGQKQCTYLLLLVNQQNHLLCGDVVINLVQYQKVWQYHATYQIFDWTTSNPKQIPYAEQLKQHKSLFVPHPFNTYVHNVPLVDGQNVVIPGVPPVTAGPQAKPGESKAR